jgi:prepilin-type processing-associated H-X9-DG protein
MLLPFISKNAKMNFQVGTDRIAFETARKTVLWGCPEWEGWREGAHFNQMTTGNYINGVSRYETGYAMNFWPTYQANFPISGSAKPPPSQTQMRWTDGGLYGKYYKRSQWTKPAERLLMVDANLWFLGFGPTTGQILAQPAGRVQADSPGQNNIDRYRHGKYPPLVGQNFALRGGKVAFNVLFVDGHASTLFDIKEGYKAIRMRYPG